MREETAQATHDELVGAIYESGADPSRWPATVGAILRAIGAQAGQLWSPALPVEAGGIAHTHQLDDAPRGDYLAYFRHCDIWTQRTLERRLAQSGRAFTDQVLVDETEWRRSEFWNDFLRTQDLYRLCVGVVDDGAGGDTPIVALASYRGVRGEAFDAAEQAFVARLLPHLRRALALQARLAPAGQPPAELALERLGLPVLVLTAGARVLFANAAAQQLAGRHPALRLREGHLRMAEGAAQRRLEELLRHAADGFRRLPSGAAAFCAGDPAAGGVILSFAPAARTLLRPHGATPAAVVFLRERGAACAPHAATLQAVYGMTPSEAALAVALARGGTVEGFAAERGISFHTARSQVRHALQKAGAARQSDLVRILLAGHAPIAE